MTATPPNIKTPVDYRAINRQTIRVDGVPKVTGSAKYTVDTRLPGTLHGRILRSPIPHARIVSIDTSAAASLKGVHSLLIAADIPNLSQGRSIFDHPVLARDRVRFAGDKVAVVAADTPEIAEAALELIEVEYEEMPGIFSIEAATAPDAPILHPEFDSYIARHDAPREHPNECGRMVREKGDIDAGFAAADQIFDHRFTTSVVHQVYMEPHACVVNVEGDKVTIWSSNKAGFDLRRQISESARIPSESIEVMTCYVGGDFGGKGAVMDEVLAYHLSKASGRPVFLPMSWIEEFQAANPRHASEVRVKTGVSKDGMIVAREGWITYDSGAYAGFKPWGMLLMGGFMHLLGPYVISHTRLTARSVYTNSVPCGHMRAPGSAQATFAGEHSITLIADELGMDQFDFRERNACAEGDEGPGGQVMKSVKLRECLAVARERSGWHGFDSARSEGGSSAAGRAAEVNDGVKARGLGGPPKLRGIGVACADRHIGGGSSSSTITVLEDGTVDVMTGTPEPGTGAHTILRQIVAETLDVPIETVSVRQESTAVAGHDDGSGGSRVTHVAGRAAMGAVEQVKEKLFNLAEDHFEAPREVIGYENGEFFPIQVPSRRVTIKQLVKKAAADGITVDGESNYTSGRVQEQSWAVQVAEVEVDPETGEIDLVRFTAVHDVGTAINPQLATGQIEGGIVQGIGQTLTEELIKEDGFVVNPSHGDYKIPAMLDTPNMDVILYEGSVSPGPYNAKSVAEICLQPVPAAIASAIHDATGEEIRHLPIKPSDVLSGANVR